MALSVHNIWQQMALLLFFFQVHHRDVQTTVAKLEVVWQTQFSCVRPASKRQKAHWEEEGGRERIVRRPEQGQATEGILE